MTDKKARELFRHRMSPARRGTGFNGPTPPVVERSREPLWVDPVVRLAARMARHFDNVLTVVEGDTGDLLDEIEDEGLREDVLQLRDICRRAAGLVSQLMAGGRSRWTEPRVVDLRELVAGLDLGAFFSGNVVFCTDVTTSPCRVWADPGHLEEMTMALVLNAREAVGSRGTVRLAVDHLSGVNVKGEIRAGWVQLEVADSGEGMDPETPGRILQPQFTTRSPGEYRRVGLSVACGIARQNAGGMHISSEPGKGTVVRVWFPSVREKAAPRPFRTSGPH